MQESNPEYFTRLRREWETAQMHKDLNTDDLSANNPELLTISIARWTTLWYKRCLDLIAGATCCYRWTWPCWSKEQTSVYSYRHQVSVHARNQFPTRRALSVFYAHPRSELVDLPNHLDTNHARLLCNRHRETHREWLHVYPQLGTNADSDHSKEPLHRLPKIENWLNNRL